ncbi:MAG: DUF2269 family protein [Candidatus Dormibacteraeota bacterium]|nr:DUF2269 family protein [Candidatus Dormibacteraeota bacterium]
MRPKESNPYTPHVPWTAILETLHVLSAIVAVGTNITYAAWGILGDREREHLGFALRGIKFLDDRIANPAYGVLLITGLLQAIFYFSITDKFVLIGLGFFAVLAVGGGAGYTPMLKRQISLLDTRGADDAEYRAASNRAAGVGMFLGVVAVAAVFVMVFQPI